MPASALPDQAGPVEDGQVVIGVDTHKDVHVVVALTATGRTLGDASFPTTAAGYRALLVWARGLGAEVIAGVEGTGSWGAGLVGSIP
jgi:hypothetical protein